MIWCRPNSRPTWHFLFLKQWKSFCVLPIVYHSIISHDIEMPILYRCIISYTIEIHSYCMPYNASDELSYWKCIVYAIVLKLDQKAFFKKRRKITFDKRDIVDNDFFFYTPHFIKLYHYVWCCERWVNEYLLIIFLYIW